MRINEARRQAIIDSYENGLSIETLEQLTGMNESTIRSVIKVEQQQAELRQTLTEWNQFVAKANL